MAVLCWTFIGSAVLCYAYAAYVILCAIALNQSEFISISTSRSTDNTWILLHNT